MKRTAIAFNAKSYWKSINGGVRERVSTSTCAPAVDTTLMSATIILVDITIVARLIVSCVGDSNISTLRLPMLALVLDISEFEGIDE